MIHRITSLEVQNFRAFRGEIAPLDLDAEVVLIYGRNASGKSSLLNALEFAITGAVQHLQNFESDYPKILTHFGGDGPGRVRLSMSTRRGENVSSQDLERQVGEEESLLDNENEDELSRVFRDSCYLSQAQLSQLLQAYQARSNVESDSPIIRFSRDFLDLDYLSRLESGLFEAGDKRRYEKIPAYDEFLDQVRSTRDELEDAKDTLEGRTRRLEEIKESIKTRAAQESLSAEESSADLLRLVQVSPPEDESADIPSVKEYLDQLEGRAPLLERVETPEVHWEAGDILLELEALASQVRLCEGVLPSVPM